MTSPDIDAAIDPAGENVVDEFVDYFNARDLDSLAELLAEDVTADFLDLGGREGVIEGIADLSIRNPGLLLTRGELGEEPVVVAWTPGENHDYRRLGFFCFTFTDDADALVEHIEYDDSPSDSEAVLAEEPDPVDMPEGLDWQEWDSGDARDEDE